MVEKHQTLKSVSVNIVGKKFLEFALKKVKYTTKEDRIMLSISKGNVLIEEGQEVRKHSKALSIPFEIERMKRIHSALGQVIKFGEEMHNGGE